LDLCTWFYVQQLYKLEDFHLKWPLPFGATWRPNIVLILESRNFITSDS
jgi:hypothetical protein